MKYELDRRNYFDGRIFEKNKLPARSYFIPYPDRISADAVTLAEKRYASPMVQCLNGNWDFCFYPDPKDLPCVLDTNTVQWDKISVPGCWQFQGYDRPFYLNTRYQFPFDPPNVPQEDEVGKVFAIMRTGNRGPGYEVPKNEHNFVGVYRRMVTISDANQQHIISFLGVASCLDLYVNGKFAGYSEGSHNTAEFDITGYLHEGEKELVAVVHRWCSGSYLECQDMFRNNGIFRDVLLYIGGSVWDIGLDTEKNGDRYSATVKVTLREECEVCVCLAGKGMDRALCSQGRNIEVQFTDLEVLEWTAETPYLYDLYIETERECIKCRVGFREVSISGRVFLLNGKAVKLRGVNHHDTSPMGGYTMKPSEIERDIKLCKAYNIDTIRTSHYPPEPYLLELCDEMGLYVVDEADLETHGAFMHRFPPSYNRITHDPHWEQHYIDRGVRLLERDKLRPCVIMWSLGNEAGGYHNTDKMYDELKKRTRLPIHYEGVIHSRRRAYDVGSQMYPSVEQVRRVGRGKARIKELNDRPYFLCEYAHAMGVGPGAMNDYWNEIYQYDALMGGCIWEMADHAVLHPDGSFTYGGDHGEWCHDGNFCVDGIFYPDRTPSTGAHIAKFVYRPLRVGYLGDGRFEIFNTMSFRNGNEYRLKFLWNDGRTAVLVTDVEPHQRTTVVVKGEEQNAAVESRVNFVTIRVEEIASGREASTEQIILSEMSPLECTARADYADFFVKNGRMHVENLLEAAEPHTLLARIATDNDRDLLGRIPMAEFYGGVEEFLSEEYSDGKITVKSRLRFKKSTFLCTDEYCGTAEGMLVTSRLHCEKGRGDLPRFGKCYRLDRNFDSISYLGRAGETYCDMRDHFPIKRVHCTVQDMTEPNIRPQESGNRMDCQYVTLSNGRDTVTFTAVDKPFELAVKPYSDAELAAMKHREDERASGTYVTIQAFQMGIGTGSCGPATRKEYRFDRRKDYEISYLISWNKE